MSTFKRYTGSLWETIGCPTTTNSGPAATLAYAEATTAQGGITTEVDLTGLSVSVTVPAGRRIRISAEVILRSSVATDAVRLAIYEGTSILQLMDATSGQQETVVGSVVLSPSAGTHTYKLRASRLAGTGTIDTLANTQYPAFILVEDITGSTLPYNPASVPVGQLAYSPVTVTQSGITGTNTLLTGMNASVVVPAGRVLRITAVGAGLATGAPVDRFFFKLFEDGVEIRMAQTTTDSSSLNQYLIVDAVRSPTAGAHTYQAYLAIAGGAGQFVADSSQVAYVLVEDITPTPAVASTAPSATLGYAESTTLAQAVTSQVDLAGLSVTVTVPAGRRLRIKGFCFVKNDTLDTRSSLYILRGASPQIQGGFTQHPAVNVNTTIEVEGIDTPAAGTHTYKLQGNPSAGTSIYGATATGHPAYILVEDITANSLPVPASTGLWQPGSQYPVAPLLGDLFYDTALGKLMVWNGTGWKAVSGGNAATLGYAQVIANQTGITGLVDATGLAVTVTVPAGRRLKITGFAQMYNDTVNTGTILHILEGTASLSRFIGSHVSTGFGVGHDAVAVISPTAGTHTYKLAAERSVGGTVQIEAAADRPAFILVEDITGDPAPSPPVSVPVGQLAYAQVTANQNFTTLVDMTGLSVNVVVPAGRVLKITARQYYSTDVGGTAVLGYIYEDAANVQRTDMTMETAARGYVTQWSVIRSPSAGAHTYKVMSERGASTGTITSNSATAPAFILVEDITPTPAVASTAPSSTLGYAEVIANQAGLGSTTDLTGLAVTVTVPAGRRLRITGHVSQLSAAAGTTTFVQLKIREGSTQLANSTEALADTYTGVEVAHVLTPTAGTHTYKLTTNGDGTYDLAAAADQPAFILVEDITANSLPVPASTGLWQPGSQYPVAPLLGDLFYDTALGKLMVWNGTGWKAVSGGNAATLGYAQVIANQGTFTASTDLTGLSVTVTVPAGRRIRVKGRTVMLSSVGTDEVQLRILEDGLTKFTHSQITNAPSGGNTFQPEVVLTPTAGTHTYKLNAVRAAGTGNVTMFANAGDPAFILVEDITGDPAPYPPVSVPVGLLAMAKNTAADFGTTSTSFVDIPGLSCNVVVPAGRTLKITVNCGFYSTVVGDTVLGELWQDGVSIQEFIKDPDLEASLGDMFSYEAYVSPAAGAHTYQVKIKRFSGTGTVNVIQRATSPATLTVEDVTPTPTASSGAPGSTLGYAAITATQTGFGNTDTDVTGLSVTVTVPAGRRIRVSAFAVIQQRTAAALDFFFIKEGATQITEDLQSVGVAEEYWTAKPSVVLTPSAGTHTYKVMVRATAGTLEVNANATTLPAWILVEDITGSVWPTGSAVTAGMVASEAWTPYTPAWTAFTIGNGTQEAAYQRIGRTIHFRVFVRWGTTTSMSGAAAVGLPVACVAAFTGPATFIQNGVREWVGTVRTHPTLIDSTHAQLIHTESGNLGNVNATSPWTWVTNDWIFISGTYEAAS